MEIEILNHHKTVTGLPQRDESALCYVGIWITGLVFYIAAKHNPVTRFHALQSILVFGFLTALYILLNMVPYVGWTMLPLWWLLSFVLWLVLIVAVHQGHEVVIPFVKKFFK